MTKMRSKVSRMFATGLLLLALHSASWCQTPTAASPKSPAPAGTTATVPPPAPKWPREYSKDGNRLVVYSPQIEDWKDHLVLQGHAAIQLVPANSKAALYGAMSFEAKTKTNPNNRSVYIYDQQVTNILFSAKDTPAQMNELVKQLLPKEPQTIGLDAVLAHLASDKLTGREIKVSTEPPKIFYSTKPAILLITQGEPVLADIKDAGFKYVLNTNWDVLVDPSTSNFYLLNKDYWLTAKSLEGPWSAAKSLPAVFSKLPADEQWKRVKENIPPKTAPPAALPNFFYNPKPAELIVFNGAPQFTVIPGTRLRYVSNTESDVFFHDGDRFFYFLTAGRWFRSTAPQDGQWELASDKLPSDFAQIPTESPKGRVLANVRGTRAADEAVLQASIPQTVTMKRVSPDVKVEYAEGQPQFVAVPGTSVSYAKNTQYDVFLVGGNYYLCYQGAWFVSANPSGPWEVAENVPQAIYQMPSDSPKYNVTYVTVYQSSPSTVTYGYTPGYMGMYIAYGCVVLGSGYYYPPYYWGPYYYPYPYYGYGMGAVYNPYTGAYVRGGAVYGPYGGYGQWSGYNPSTGRYARGAGWYGPYDAGRYSQSYNPRTGTYSQRYAYTNYEQAWGGGYAQRGDQWAQTKWYADERGAVGGVRTSQGTGAIGGVGEDSRGFVAKGQDNLYAGKDGNAYKRDQNGNWYKYDQGSGWTSATPPQNPRQGQQTTSAPGNAGTTSAAQPRQPGTLPAQQPATGQSRTAPGQPSTGQVQPGTPRSGASQLPSTAQSGRPQPQIDSNTLSGLNRDAAARQTGAQRSQQYQNWGSSASSRGSFGGGRSAGMSRGGGGMRRR